MSCYERAVELFIGGFMDALDKLKSYNLATPETIEVMGDPSFDRFWNSYPRKTGDKARAKKLFNALEERERFNAILGSIYQTTHNPQWSNKSLIPHPTTFLNQKRWNDEIVENKGAKERATENHSTHVDRAWALLVGLYGEAWIRRFGESPPPMWTSLLNNLSEERIKRAIRRLVQMGGDFPCSLPKFAECAATTFEEQYPTALPKTIKTDKVTALKHLAEIRKALT